MQHVRLDRRNKRFSSNNCSNDNRMQHYKKVWIPLGYKSAFFEKRHDKIQDSRYFSITRNSRFNGNTLLFQLPNYSFIFINEHGKSCMFCLELGDFVIKFVSLVGKNDKSYPVIIGKWNYYFLRYKTRVHRRWYRVDRKSLPDILLLYYNYYRHIQRCHKHILRCN